MPTYDYKCKNPECGIEYEEWFSSIKRAEEEEKDTKCPKCESKEKERMVPKNVSFILNGPNWAAKGKRGY